ncbi:MAG: coenzyme F420-0:L-glutamate ligase [Candidatus Bathyarchaeia archaeon]
MVKYKARAISTGYWHPGDNYIKKIIESIKDRVIDGDFVVISEKAISTAMGNIVDENSIKPSLSARILAKFWMRIIWGYLLGPLCGMQNKMIERLRRYPLESGSKHKQLILQRFGLIQALMFGSEGGVDGSNLPYAYVSLPLMNAEAIAEKIRRAIICSLKKRVYVMIVDTDRTFSFRNFHFTYRPKPMRGIHYFPGVIGYVFGRMFRLKSRATPLAVAGISIDVEEA